MPLNLPYPSGPSASFTRKSTTVSEADTIIAVRKFLEEYGVLSPSEMSMVQKPKGKGKPTQYVVGYPYDNEVLFTLFKFTVYANQATLCEFYDTKQNKLVEQDAIQAVKQLTRRARELAIEAGQPKTRTGAALILRQQQFVATPLTDSQIVTALRASLSTTRMITMLKSNISVENFAAADEIPDHWLKKMI